MKSSDPSCRFPANVTANSTQQHPSRCALQPLAPWYPPLLPTPLAGAFSSLPAPPLAGAFLQFAFIASCTHDHTVTQTQYPVCSPSSHLASAILVHGFAWRISQLHTVAFLKARTVDDQLALQHERSNDEKGRLTGCSALNAAACMSRQVRTMEVSDPTPKHAATVPRISMSRSIAVRALRGLLAASSRNGVLPAAARSVTEGLGKITVSLEPSLADAARLQAPSRGFAAAATGGGGSDSTGSGSANQRNSAWEEVSRLSAAATEMAEEGRTEEAKALLKRGKQRVPTKVFLHCWRLSVCNPALHSPVPIHPDSCASAELPRLVDKFGTEDPSVSKRVGLVLVAVTTVPR